MKKQNLFYLFLILIVFNSCKKEETEIEINYASNPIQYNIDGTFLSQDKIAFLWWDGTSEKIGLFNSNTDSLIVIGTVGDLQWWQQQCIVKDDTLYTFGFNENDKSMNMLYKNDLGTGELISKTEMSADMSNITIAGRHKDEIILLWWDGTSEKFGTLNSNSNTITIIGTVGDLQWWQRLCFVTENTLYTFGFNENDNSMNMLYKNKLGTGNLISKSNYNTTLINLTISKNK